jgi:hypothetical protein
MIGMPIKAPGCQDQVARLEVLLQPIFQALFVRTDRAVGDAEMKRGSRPDTEFAQRCGKLGASRRAQAFWRPPVLVRIARFAIGHGDDAYLHALLRSVTEQSTTAEDLVVWMGCDHHDAIMAGAQGIGRCCRPLPQPIAAQPCLLLRSFPCRGVLATAPMSPPGSPAGRPAIPNRDLRGSAEGTRSGPRSDGRGHPPGTSAPGPVRARQIQDTRRRALDHAAQAHDLFAMRRFRRGVDARRHFAKQRRRRAKARSTSPSNRARFPSVQAGRMRSARAAAAPNQTAAMPAPPCQKPGRCRYSSRVPRSAIGAPSNRTVVDGTPAMPTAGQGSSASVRQCFAATWHSHTPCALRTVTNAASTHALPEHQGLSPWSWPWTSKRSVLAGPSAAQTASSWPSARAGAFSSAMIAWAS